MADHNYWNKYSQSLNVRPGENLLGLARRT